MNPPPPLTQYITDDGLADLAQRARREDLGPDELDVTSLLFIPENSEGSARFVARQPGVIAGIATLTIFAEAYHHDLEVELLVGDGRRVEPGEELAVLAGPTRAVLACERVALNLIGRLSGIATLTAACVAECEGTKAKILDTRKTTPTLRGLEKYAVACGGGTNHRMGLYDAVLLKDNHLAHVPGDALRDRVRAAVERARSEFDSLKFIEVEVDTLKQLEAVLPTGVDIVLLDNQDAATLQRAVKLRDETAPSVELEASGGVTLDTLAELAATGVDRLSIGALTHSAPALDIALDHQPPTGPDV
ncbi:MAG: carboxylating nicotinate-nucleotide diphosphorylase [Phycisphaeraceae bacterium]